MNLAVTQRRDEAGRYGPQADRCGMAAGAEIKKAGQEWLDNMDDAEGSKAAG